MANNHNTRIKVLEFARSFEDQHGRSPTLDEATAALPISRAVASYHLCALSKMGLISYPVVRDYGRQAQVLAFIEDYYRKHGMGPIAREVAEHFGTSTKNMSEIMRKLLEAKQVAAINRGHRYIVPLWAKE